MRVSVFNRVILRWAVSAWLVLAAAAWRSLNGGLPVNSVTALVTDPADPGRLYATVPQNGIYGIEVP